MSVLDIEVQRVRVKLEGNALIDLWRLVVFFQKKKSKSCSRAEHDFLLRGISGKLRPTLTLTR